VGLINSSSRHRDLRFSEGLSREKGEPTPRTMLIKGSRVVIRGLTSAPHFNNAKVCECIKLTTAHNEY